MPAYCWQSQWRGGPVRGELTGERHAPDHHAPRPAPRAQARCDVARRGAARRDGLLRDKTVCRKRITVFQNEADDPAAEFLQPAGPVLARPPKRDSTGVRGGSLPPGRRTKTAAYRLPSRAARLPPTPGGLKGPREPRGPRRSWLSLGGTSAGAAGRASTKLTEPREFTGLTELA